MRNAISSVALATLALVVVSCSDLPTAPKASDEVIRTAPRLTISAPTLPAVRFSEIHYDNTGTDAGEAIEISGPAGTNLTGWKIYLYNGNGGAVYLPTITLSATIPATCGSRGVVVTNYSVNGIQNGDPDAFALVDNSGNVIELLSYGGSFVAVGGPADGMVTKSIGVKEPGAVGASLQRDQAGTWFPPAANTFGTCNDVTAPSVANTVASVTVSPTTFTLTQGANVQITATAKNSSNVTIPGAYIGWSSSDASVATVDPNGAVTTHAAGNVDISATSTNGITATATLTVTATPPGGGLSDVRFSEIHYDNDGGDIGERIEIEGPAGGNLSGWKVVLYNATGGVVYDTKTLSTTIPASCGTRGVVTITYATNGIQNGPSDGFALVNSGGQVVEFLSYEGTLTATNGPATGLLSTDIGVLESGSGSENRSLQRAADGSWYGPALNTFDACNPATPPPPAIFFTGRTPGDVALPVGFQDQLFASLEDASGNPITTTFTWTSETPGIATIDQDGVFTAVSAGTAILRATAATGATGTWSLPTTVAVASGTASYAGNTEFGIPTDADATDDFIVTHPEYTSSFNKNRGTPNWVSYDLEISHFGPQDRCDCFTYDPALPADYQRYTTAAYTGAAAKNGYGIDRGHMTRSFDRTSGSLDNAYTFYFSNVVPQASDLNQGPWAIMENYLGDQARLNNKEVYIIAGVAGNNGTVKNEGLIVIPAQTWKVAVIMDKDKGLADVHSASDVQVIAVIMPNVPGVRNVDWHTYETTVDAVEALSGYNLLSSLPDQIEIAVESNTVPPVAATDGPYNTGALPLETIAMSAAGSSDADAGQTLTYAWDFGDGQTGTGVNVTHAYTTGGVYTVTVTVTDPLGLTSTASTTATVLTQQQGIANAQTIVNQLLSDGKLNGGNANSLTSKLNAALASFNSGGKGAGVNQLNALLNEIDALIKSKRLSESDAASLRALINRIIASAA
ncbi:MAG TPA: DNA/RNA non-specific endonuclease [Gemmatimonadaceae bacterium]|nr:DNA/RNA non-specific endonuclease [Gemmatimonadaceae bacterium]